MNRTTKIILFSLTFLISHVVFLIILFPLDAVLSDVLSNPNQFIQSRKGDEIEVQASSVDASLFFDTELKNFKLLQGGKVVFEAPDLEFGFSLLPLLTKSVDLNFRASYGRSGQIDGDFSMSGNSYEVGAEIQELPLSKLNALNDYLESFTVNEQSYPIKLRGILSGEAYYSWSQDLRNREGEIDLKLFHALLRPTQYKIPIPGTKETFDIDVPLIRFSSRKDPVIFQGSVDGKSIRVKKFLVPGPHIQLQLDGNIDLDNQGGILNLNLKGQMSFAEAFANRFTYVEMLESDLEGGGYSILIKGSPRRPQIKIGTKDFGQMIR